MCHESSISTATRWKHLLIVLGVLLLAVQQVAPLVLTASVRNTNILLKWARLPEEETDTFEGYEIQYGMVGTSEIMTILISDPNTMETEIKHLRPLTVYSVSVKPISDAGSGTGSNVEIKTGRIEKPRFTHITGMTSRSFVVYWEAPDVSSRSLYGYLITLTNGNTSDTKPSSGDITAFMSEQITGLQPYTEYRVTVRADAEGGLGEYSDPYPVLTDVAEPSAPEIMNVTVLSTTSVYVQWMAPKIVYKNVNSYVIEVSYESNGEKRSVHMVTGSEHEKVITDLPANTTLKLKIAAVTRSIFSTSNYTGDFSDEVLFKLEVSEQTMSTEAPEDDTGLMKKLLQKIQRLVKKVIRLL